MNIALLNGYEIDLEEKSMEYQNQGLDREEVRRKLEGRFRKFSKKGSFTCTCCGERVKMVLPSEKAFHFQHFDSKACSYSENHQTYNNHRERLENESKHAFGKAVLRAHLESMCKVNGWNLIEGTRYKNKLSFVPDFMIESPNEINWAINYLTGLKNDSKYANHLKKRQNHYKANQFIPIFLFDRDWLAYEPEINYVSLVDGELLSINQTEEDAIWTRFIDNLDPTLKSVLLNDCPYELKVKSMSYASPRTNEITIIRFISAKNQPNSNRTVCEPIHIPINEAFMINQDSSNFNYTSKDEDHLREALKEELIKMYQQKEEQKAKELEERKKQVTEITSTSVHAVPFQGRTKEQMDRDLERENAFLKRNNNVWHKQMLQHIRNGFGEK